jgi:preprotein translocase subunit SecD
MGSFRAAAAVWFMVATVAVGSVCAQGVLEQSGMPGALRLAMRAPQFDCKALEATLEMRSIGAWDALNIVPDHPPAREDLTDAALRRLGRTRLVLEVDGAALRKAMLREAQDHMRRIAREARLGTSAAVTIRNDMIELRPRHGVEAAVVANALAPLTSSTVPLLVSRNIDGDRAAYASMAFAVSDQAFEERLRYAAHASIIHLEQRISVLGSEPPLLQALDGGRILAIVPGLSGADRLLGLAMDKYTYGLTFQPVEHSIDPCGQLEAFPSHLELQMQWQSAAVVVQKAAIASAHDLVAVAVVQDAGTGQGSVAIRLSGAVSSRLARFTEDNVGKAVALLTGFERSRLEWGYHAIGAAVIREPIADGAVLLSGGMNLQEARSLALQLRLASTPAKLTVIEQQVVEPKGFEAKPQ